MASFDELKSAYETEVKSLQDAVKGVSAEVTIEDGNVTIPEKGYAEVKRIKKNVFELEDLLKASETKSAFEAAAEGAADNAARFYNNVAEYKSVADRLLESDEYKEMIEQRRYNMREDVKLEMRDIVSYKDNGVWTGQDQGTSPRGFGIVHQELPFVNPKQLTTRVRDLFPQASTTANLLEYFKSTGWTLAGGSNPTTAAFVSERTGITSSAPNGTAFGLKPESKIDFTSASDPVKTIAHWVAAHRNALADQPQMRSIIDNELLYGLALKEDDALLNGDGNNDSIKGLLNRSGIQTYTPSNTNSIASDQPSDNIRRAMTLCELAFFPSTGVVVHPIDWERMELQKDGVGSYMLTTNVAVGAQKRLWQVPVVSTPAIAQGSFLTGAFGQAAQVYDREQANIRVAEQHADFFVRNAVVVLAEERLALTTPRPEGLVHGSYSNGTVTATHF